MAPRALPRLTIALAALLMTLLLAGCSTLAPQSIPTPRAATAQPGPVVVVDIDGTLTPHNLFPFEVRPGAAEVLRSYANKGYRIAYLTTRIPAFQWFLPAWLDDNGFPRGALHVAQSAAERDDPAAFKAGLLARYSSAGWRLAYAYGDSPSDFEAYARAGIPQAHVFALRRRFASTCAGEVFSRCLDGWVEHLKDVERDVAPAR